MHFTITDDRMHHKTWNRARDSRRKEARLAPVTFHAIDGEGITDEAGNHYYVLLGIGSDQISNAEGLTWAEIFQFLWDHYQSGNHAWTGFYLGYDFTEWLASIPEERARMLLTEPGKAKRARKVKSRLGETYFPVYLDKWEFDILGAKRFKLRPRGTQEWMYICDGGPFFQSSFLSTIDPEKWDEPICTPEEFEKVKIGKSRRSTAELDQEMMFYNALENEINERLMGELQKGLLSIEVGLKPQQWFGPGQVAQAWMSQRKSIPVAKKLNECVPDWFMDAARKTYYGGWFELFAHGLIDGESHEYDINSAYPYIIHQLPCLLHGSYSHGRGKPRQQRRATSRQIPLCIVRGTVHGYAPSRDHDATHGSSDRRNGRLGAMLHRCPDGSILRPTKTRGYFWLHELEAARRAGCIRRVEYEHWFTYEPCECTPPLAEVAELYALRLRVGKNTALGKAIKLLINSIYGKFAQSIGNPKYGNAIYASLITAGCRTMILDAIATHPNGQSDVLMVATDGVYFQNPHPTLRLSSNLGDWEHNIHHDLCLFKPGMYWSRKDRLRILEGKAPIFKARGIKSADFAEKISQVDAAFRRWPKRVAGNLTARESFAWPEVEFTGSFALTSCLQALQWGRWSQAGAVKQNIKLKQSSNARKKRDGLWYDRTSRIYRSDPWEPGIWFETDSVPYEKRFGIEDPWSIESLEEFGITPDATVKDLFTEILMDHG